MADVTPETLRDISIAAVEDFLNNKVPLSQGLAKQAAAHELNVEQVKRAVESTNNIAYLKILQHSEDRTVEFPLAKFAEVMASATIPESFQEKLAAVKTDATTSMEKTASAEVTHELTDNEARHMFIKAAYANKAALESLELESMNMVELLVKSAKEIAKDAQWMDKLACVTTEDEFKQLSLLVSADKQKYRDLKDLGLFKEAQLREVSKFSGLFKQAQAIVREQRERSGLQKRADETAKSLRTGFMEGAIQAAKNSTSKIMGAPGYVAGKALGNVAKLPLQAAQSTGEAVSSSLKSNFRKAMNSGSGAAGSAVKAVGSTGASAAKTVMRAAGPIADAAFYDPGVNSSTGRSNDVWSALQRD